MTSICKGTYVSVILDDVTKQGIMEYIELANIPNPVTINYLHCTLVCTENEIPHIVTINKYHKPFIGMPDKLNIWKTKTGLNCLVLTFKCNSLDQRHVYLIEDYTLCHRFPTYISHITLSYDVGDLDINSLPDIKDSVQKIVILGESCPTCVLCDENKVCKQKQRI